MAMFMMEGSRNEVRPETIRDVIENSVLRSSNVELRREREVIEAMAFFIERHKLEEFFKAFAEHDPGTTAHSLRMAADLVDFELERNSRSESLEGRVLGGSLHDIGKIKVPEHILQKPGKLTAEERAIVDMHPVLGYQMLFEDPQFSSVLKVPLAKKVLIGHHAYKKGAEKNGAYPFDLSKPETLPNDFYGEDVAAWTPEDRLIVAESTAADVLDALGHDRPYAEARKTAEEIARAMRDTENLPPALIAAATSRFHPRPAYAAKAAA